METYADTNKVLESVAASMPYRPSGVREVFRLTCEGPADRDGFHHGHIVAATFVGYRPVLSLPNHLRG